MLEANKHKKEFDALLYEKYGSYLQYGMVERPFDDYIVKGYHIGDCIYYLSLNKNSAFVKTTIPKLLDLYKNYEATQPTEAGQRLKWETLNHTILEALCHSITEDNYKAAARIFYLLPEPHVGAIDKIFKSHFEAMKPPVETPSTTESFRNSASATKQSGTVTTQSTAEVKFKNIKAKDFHKEALKVMHIMAKEDITKCDKYFKSLSKAPSGYKKLLFDEIYDLFVKEHMVEFYENLNSYQKGRFELMFYGNIDAYEFLKYCCSKKNLRHLSEKTKELLATIFGEWVLGNCNLDYGLEINNNILEVMLSTQWFNKIGDTDKKYLCFCDYVKKSILCGDYKSETLSILSKIKKKIYFVLSDEEKRQYCESMGIKDKTRSTHIYLANIYEIFDNPAEYVLKAGHKLLFGNATETARLEFLKNIEIIQKTKSGYFICSNAKSIRILLSKSYCSKECSNPTSIYIASGLDSLADEEHLLKSAAARGVLKIIQNYKFRSQDSSSRNNLEAKLKENQLRIVENEDSSYIEFTENLSRLSQMKTRESVINEIKRILSNIRIAHVTKKKPISGGISKQPSIKAEISIQKEEPAALPKEEVSEVQQDRPKYILSDKKVSKSLKSPTKLCITHNIDLATTVQAATSFNQEKAQEEKQDQEEQQEQEQEEKQDQEEQQLQEQVQGQDKSDQTDKGARQQSEHYESLEGIAFFSLDAEKFGEFIYKNQHSLAPENHPNNFYEITKEEALYGAQKLLEQLGVQYIHRDAAAHFLTNKEAFQFIKYGIQHKDILSKLDMYIAIDPTTYISIDPTSRLVACAKKKLKKSEPIIRSEKEEYYIKELFEALKKDFPFKNKSADKLPSLTDKPIPNIDMSGYLACKRKQSPKTTRIVSDALGLALPDSHHAFITRGTIITGMADRDKFQTLIERSYPNNAKQYMDMLHGVERISSIDFRFILLAAVFFNEKKRAAEKRAAIEKFVLYQVVSAANALKAVDGVVPYICSKEDKQQQFQYTLMAFYQDDGVLMKMMDLWYDEDTVAQYKNYLKKLEAISGADSKPIIYGNILVFLREMAISKFMEPKAALAIFFSVIADMEKRGILLYFAKVHFSKGSSLKYFTESYKESYYEIVRDVEFEKEDIERVKTRLAIHAYCAQFGAIVYSSDYIGNWGLFKDKTHIYRKLVEKLLHQEKMLTICGNICSPQFISKTISDILDNANIYKLLEEQVDEIGGINLESKKGKASVYEAIGAGQKIISWDMHYDPSSDVSGIKEQVKKAWAEKWCELDTSTSLFRYLGAHTRRKKLDFYRKFFVGAESLVPLQILYVGKTTGTSYRPNADNTKSFCSLRDFALNLIQESKCNIGDIYPAQNILELLPYSLNYDTTTLLMKLLLQFNAHAIDKIKAEKLLSYTNKQTLFSYCDKWVSLHVVYAEYFTTFLKLASLTGAQGLFSALSIADMSDAFKDPMHLTFAALISDKLDRKKILELASILGALGSVQGAEFFKIISHISGFKGSLTPITLKEFREAVDDYKRSKETMKVWFDKVFKATDCEYEPNKKIKHKSNRTLLDILLDSETYCGYSVQPKPQYNFSELSNIENAPEILKKSMDSKDVLSFIKINGLKLDEALKEHFTSNLIHGCYNNILKAMNSIGFKKDAKKASDYIYVAASKTLAERLLIDFIKSKFSLSNNLQTYTNLVYKFLSTRYSDETVKHGISLSLLNGYIEEIITEIEIFSNVIEKLTNAAPLINIKELERILDVYTKIINGSKTPEFQGQIVTFMVDFITKYGKCKNAFDNLSSALTIIQKYQDKVEVTWVYNKYLLENAIHFSFTKKHFKYNAAELIDTAGSIAANCNTVGAANHFKVILDISDRWMSDDLFRYCTKLKNENRLTIQALYNITYIIENIDNKQRAIKFLEMVEGGIEDFHLNFKLKSYVANIPVAQPQELPVAKKQVSSFSVPTSVQEISGMLANATKRCNNTVQSVADSASSKVDNIFKPVAKAVQGQATKIVSGISDFLNLDDVSLKAPSSHIDIASLESKKFSTIDEENTSLNLISEVITALEKHKIKLYGDNQTLIKALSNFDDASLKCILKLFKLPDALRPESAMISRWMTEPSGNIIENIEKHLLREYQKNRQVYAFDLNAVRKTVDDIKVWDPYGNKWVLAPKADRDNLFLSFEEMVNLFEKHKGVLVSKPDGTKVYLTISELTNTQMIEARETCIKTLSDKNASWLEKYDAALGSLALSCVAMHRTTGKFPRHTQILEALKCIVKKGNSLSQIDTGEGKGIIAVLKALYRHTTLGCVCVAPSSDILAERDAEEFNSVFEFFDIPCSDKAITNNSVWSDWLPTGINYSTPSNLFLFSKAQLLEGREIDWRMGLILDEADAALTTPVANILSVTIREIFYAYHDKEWAQIHKALLKFIQTDIFERTEPKNYVANFKEYFLKEFPKSLDHQVASKFLTSSGVTDKIIVMLINAAISAREQGEDTYIATEIVATKQKNGLEIKKLERTAAPIILTNHKADEKVSWAGGVQSLVHQNNNDIQKEQRDSEQAKFKNASVTETIAVGTTANLIYSIEKAGGITDGITGSVGSGSELRREFMEVNKFHSITKQPRYLDDKRLSLGTILVNTAEDARKLMSECVAKIHEDKKLPFLVFWNSPNLVKSADTHLKGSFEERVLKCAEILKNNSNGDIQAAMEAMGIKIDLYTKDPAAEIIRVIKDKYPDKPGVDQVELFLADLTKSANTSISSPLEIYKDLLKTTTIEHQAYSGDLSYDHKDSDQVKLDAGKIGLVTNATQAMGRGIDFAPPKDLSFFELNCATTDVTEADVIQVHGRVGRNGAPGYILDIVILEDLKERLDAEQFASLKERADKSKEALKEAIGCYTNSTNPSSELLSDIGEVQKWQDEISRQRHEERMKYLPLHQVRDYVMTNYFFKVKQRLDKAAELAYGKFSNGILTQEETFISASEFNQQLEEWFDEYLEAQPKYNEEAARLALCNKAAELWNIRLDSWLSKCPTVDIKDPVLKIHYLNDILPSLNKMKTAELEKASGLLCSLRSLFPASTYFSALENMQLAYSVILELQPILYDIKIEDLTKELIEQKLNILIMVSQKLAGRLDEKTKTKLDEIITSIDKKKVSDLIHKFLSTYKDKNFDINTASEIVQEVLSKKKKEVAELYRDHHEETIKTLRLVYDICYAILIIPEAIKEKASSIPLFEFDTNNKARLEKIFEFLKNRLNAYNQNCIDTIAGKEVKDFNFIDGDIIKVVTAMFIGVFTGKTELEEQKSPEKIEPTPEKKEVAPIADDGKPTADDMKVMTTIHSIFYYPQKILQYYNTVTATAGAAVKWAGYTYDAVSAVTALGTGGISTVVMQGVKQGAMNLVKGYVKDRATGVAQQFAFKILKEVVIASPLMDKFSDQAKKRINSSLDLMLSLSGKLQGLHAFMSGRIEEIAKKYPYVKPEALDIKPETLIEVFKSILAGKGLSLAMIPTMPMGDIPVKVLMELIQDLVNNEDFMAIETSLLSIAGIEELKNWREILKRFLIELKAYEEFTLSTVQMPILQSLMKAIKEDGTLAKLMKEYKSNKAYEEIYNALMNISIDLDQFKELSFTQILQTVALLSHQKFYEFLNDIPDKSLELSNLANLLKSAKLLSETERDAINDKRVAEAEVAVGRLREYFSDPTTQSYSMASEAKAIQDKYHLSGKALEQLFCTTPEPQVESPITNGAEPLCNPSALQCFIGKPESYVVEDDLGARIEADVKDFVAKISDDRIVLTHLEKIQKRLSNLEPPALIYDAYSNALIQFMDNPDTSILPKIAPIIDMMHKLKGEKNRTFEAFKTKVTSELDDYMHSENLSIDRKALCNKVQKELIECKTYSEVVSLLTKAIVDSKKDDEDQMWLRNRRFIPKRLHRSPSDRFATLLSRLNEFGQVYQILEGDNVAAQAFFEEKVKSSLTNDLGENPKLLSSLMKLLKEQNFDTIRSALPNGKASQYLIPLQLSHNQSSSHIASTSFELSPCFAKVAANENANRLANLDMTLSTDIRCRLEYIKGRVLYYVYMVTNAPSLIYCKARAAIDYSAVRASVKIKSFIVNLDSSSNKIVESIPIEPIVEREDKVISQEVMV